MSRYNRVDIAYNFLINKEKSGLSFSIEELADYVGWKPQSCKTYLSKRWFQFIQKKDHKYEVRGISFLSQEDFRKLNCQNLEGVSDSSEREMLIKKAKEFALIAVATYNNPFIALKTHGFIVNIVIAFTALFHAIFDKSSIDYLYKDKQGNQMFKDGEAKAWELSKCCEEYWSGQSPEKSNLKFLIGLRNKIEHRSLPYLDLIVAGYCQAALLNFEEILVNEFGNKHALMANLAMAMQMTRVANEQQTEAMKCFQRENYKVIREYMRTFSDDLSNEIIESQKYRLSVFLVPKIGSRASTTDLAIEFVNATNLDEEELKAYNHAIALIKGVESQYKLRPGKVVEQVKIKIPEFNMTHHTKLWKKYKARPSKKMPKYKGKYSGYVEGFDGYLYSQDWVNFIIEELS
ncbi:TPA: DUF3644 domain-containing protein [Legionella pneumophila]|nr:DUF3644 domain-containing protein [Legionella pneumophila]